MKCFRVLPFLLGLFAAGPAGVRAAVSWSFDYTGSTHFNTSAAGLARRAALESAAVTLGSWFNHTATVTIKVISSSVNNNNLASASSNYPDHFAEGFGSSGYVRNRILTGSGNPAGADGEVEVNFFHNWALGDTVASDAFDFKATMMHELLHAAGFISEIYEDGTDAWNSPPGTPGMFSLFDKFLTNSAGQPIINPGTFALVASRWNAAKVGGGTEAAPLTTGLYFSGPQAMAANGGLPVRIYSPNPWEEGSSASHLDDFFYQENLMMKSTTTTGPGPRTLKPFEIGMLKDLGYSMAGSTPPSVIAAWRTTHFGNATLRTGNSEDFDGDGESNLEEFALGTNPAATASGPSPLEYTGTFSGNGTIARTGQPVIRTQGSSDTRALYVRRKDYVAAGLTYTQRFTADLTSWQTSATAPTVLADDGVHQIVSVPWPTISGGRKGYFRLEIAIPP